MNGLCLYPNRIVKKKLHITLNNPVLRNRVFYIYKGLTKFNTKDFEISYKMIIFNYNKIK